MVEKSKRLVSLDAFRGITIAAMILVNNPGTWNAVYKPLQHAHWNGWTPTDLIFPFFLFIVGVAIVFAFSKRLTLGQTKKDLYLKIIRRTLILFGLGLFLNGFPFFNLSTIRIPGVLQRIAITYFFASIIYLNFDIKVIYYITFGILAVYWIIMKTIPVPGYGAGVLEPVGNLCWYIDSHIFRGHTWAGAPAPGFDPEGLLSTLPAISSVLFGILTGNYIKRKINEYEKVSSLFVWGFFAVIGGYIVSIWFPINKNLWTSSYVLLTTGMALIFLATCYWLIDIKGYKKWSVPFLIYGSNAITVYTLSGIIARMLIFLFKVKLSDGEVITLKAYLFRTLFASWLPPHQASLAYAIVYDLILLGFMTILYKKKIFIKV
ncbi:MAG: DUF5009 domain-containing protein [Candidatus Neomarinimicrobiota bacterium]|nr:DUF5009 domain-containing protein [Candidatus Neomarinimicrobiota bacterium]RKY52662.1 MAG: DUF5009 domain-containing protein [Candidatus Neomarinimicrobiota bacterium]